MKEGQKWSEAYWKGLIRLEYDVEEDFEVFSRLEHKIGIKPPVAGDPPTVDPSKYTEQVQYIPIANLPHKQKGKNYG